MACGREGGEEGILYLLPAFITKMAAYAVYACDCIRWLLFSLKGMIYEN
jgi:hypothetical protein